MPSCYPGHQVMVDIEGSRLDAATADFLRQHQIRGVCLFRKNLVDATQLRHLCAELRAVLGPSALIGIDQEGGSVARITFLPQAPSAMALGAVADAALAQQVGAAVSRGLRSMGINWNFAPVVDVNNNPGNPVIAERSFGEDADLVARMAAAWMQGALSQGVACCVKHFPGHGDTHMDSHHGLPSVDKSLTELEALELRPFRALASTAPAIMTAHIVYPQIDPDHPATLSRRVLGGILRQAIGYQGVVITDALMMKAVHDHYGHARAAVMALQAGADMVLAQGERSEQLAALQAIAQAQQDGSLPRDETLRSCQRLQDLAQRFAVQLDAPYSAAQRQADEALMQQAWLRGLSALGAARAPGLTQPLRVITQDSVASDGVSEAGPGAADVRAMFAGFADVEYVCLQDLLALQAQHLSAGQRLNVLVSNHRKRYTGAARLVRPDLHLVLWNPFQAMDIDAPTLITWGYAHGALAAARQWLHGQAQAQAQPPVCLTPLQP